MALDLKLTLELDPEATVIADASISSVEKGQATLVINYRIVAKKTGKVLAAGRRLTFAADGKTVSNEKNDPVGLVLPNNFEGRLADFSVLCQESLQAARDCGEIPESLTISPGL